MISKGLCDTEIWSNE